MQAMPMFFGNQVLVPLVMLLGGVGLPLGVPPEKENPNLAYVAPPECVLYAAWAGMAQANPESGNQTEQLLAEPEIRQFAAAAEQALSQWLAERAQREGGENAELMAKTGPLWVRTILTRPTAVFVSRLEVQPNGPSIEGGLIVHAGDAAAQLDYSLTTLLSSEEQQPREVTIAGLKFRELPADPRGLPMRLVWGTSNGYLMIGLGDGAIAGMSTRMAAKKEPAWLTQVKQQLPVERRSTISYVNVRRLYDTLVPLGGPQAEAILASLGAKQIVSLQTVTGLDEQGVVSKSLLAIDGEPRGLLAALGNAPIAAENLRHIPHDALFATAVSFEFEKALAALLQTLKETDPRGAAALDEALRDLEFEIGAGPRDLFAALGPHVSLHASPADGGVMGAALAIGVRDRDKLLAAQERVFPLITRATGDEGLIVRTPYAGQTIHHYAGGQLFLPVAPAWSIAEKNVVVGLNPQAVKSVLLRKADDKSLADLPQIAPHLAGPNPPVALMYYDTQAFFDTSYGYVQMMAPMLLGQMRREGTPVPFDTALIPAPRTISRHLRPSVTIVRRTERGLASETHQTLPAANIGASGPLAAALLLPAVQSAREAARRSSGANNLKQMLLALHNYHDTYRGFPPAFSTTKDGKPLLSWRVALLPFLEQQALYEQFHLDEPWDSEHNKQLIAQMPEVFKAPGSKAQAGTTVYLGVGGKNGVLSTPEERPAEDGQFGVGIGLQHVTDGSSNTLAIVEASDEAAVIWTKPEEWVPDADNPLKGLVGLRPSGFQAAMCDGSVRFISKNIDLEILRRLFDRQDGQPVELPVGR